MEHIPAAPRQQQPSLSPAPTPPAPPTSAPVSFSDQDLRKISEHMAYILRPMLEDKLRDLFSDLILQKTPHTLTPGHSAHLLPPPPPLPCDRRPHPTPPLQHYQNA